jgi:hypothetical protein
MSLEGHLLSTQSGPELLPLPEDMRVLLRSLEVVVTMRRRDIVLRAGE